MTRRSARFTQAEIPPEIAEKLKRVTGHVYFIVAEKVGAIKIGFSNDPRARFTNLNTGSAEPLLWYGSIPGNREDEVALHKKFAQHRMKGEWFRECDEIYNHIDDLAEDNEDLQAFWELVQSA